MLLKYQGQRPGEFPESHKNTFLRFLLVQIKTIDLLYHKVCFEVAFISASNSDREKLKIFFQQKKGFFGVFGRAVYKVKGQPCFLLF